MKKVIFAIGFFIGAFTSYTVFSQQNDMSQIKKVYDAEHDEYYLVGEIVDIQLLKKESGFEMIGDEAALNTFLQTDGTVNQITSAFQDVEVVICLGTWCGDSQTYVPEILNILQVANLPKEQIKIFALDRKKVGLNNEEKTYNIEFVPTVIFYRNNQEIGRFIESPSQTILEDFMQILLK